MVVHSNDRILLFDNWNIIWCIVSNDTYVDIPWWSMNEIEPDNRKFRASRTNRFLLCEDKKLIGGVNIHSNSVRGKTLFLTDLEIFEKYKNAGYGVSLLDCVFEFAKINNYNRIILNVNIANKLGRKLYKKYGFRQSSLTDKNDDELLMVKLIKNG